jgi:hypothetical protein
MNDNEIETNETEVEYIDPIEVIHAGECLSVSGRSDLTYVVGRHAEDGTLHLAITGNSGGGMWCKDFCSASDIQDIVLGKNGLTAKSFHPLHAGRSINTGGFVLAAIRELGLIRANEENTRVHEHVPGTTFEKVVSAFMAQAKAVKEVKPVSQEAAGRKTLKLKPKES